MTQTDFTAALDALGMTQARLARLLDLDKNTPNRWAKGLARIPKPVEVLLTIWRAHPDLIPEA